MRLSYDREEDILTIEMSQGSIIDHAEHTGPFIAHLSQDGQIVLLEILDASEFLAALVKTTVRSQGQPLPLSS